MQHSPTKLAHQIKESQDIHINVFKINHFMHASEMMAQMPKGFYHS